MQIAEGLVPAGLGEQAGEIIWRQHFLRQQQRHAEATAFIGQKLRGEFGGHQLGDILVAVHHRHTRRA